MVEMGPVLKWAGGKRQLLPELLKRIPRSIETYYEPFLGGGALFFALARERRFRRAVIADKNRELVDVYRAIQKDVEGVLAALAELAERHSEEQYYRVRDARPRALTTRAARILYLNRTGYNGLYRVNRRGDYNVPFGRYENPKIVNAELLRLAAVALSNAVILEADFEDACRGAKRGDAVYLDPPYVPVSATSSFAHYHHEPFGIEEHRRLARVFGELERAGVTALLSNSHTRETRELYAPFACTVVKARRAINSDAGARGPIGELLVVSRPAERLTRRSRPRAP